MRCGINRGAKGIALLNEDRWGTKLRYVIDISDVNEGFGRGRKPKLWQLKERDRESVLHGLPAFIEYLQSLEDGTVVKVELEAPEERSGSYGR